MRVVVVNHISLDGVIQGPAGPAEDTSGGFRHGGWAAGAVEPEMGEAMGRAMGEGFSWLFGRRSYDDMLGHWNEVGGPFKDGLNDTTKYVASSRADADLPWPNSTLLTGDVPAEVAALRERDGGNLVVMGSSRLIQSLVPRGLVDEMVLFVHPVVLGSGLRMFGADSDVRRFRLVSSAATSSGVLVTAYAQD